MGIFDVRLSQALALCKASVVFCKSLVHKQCMMAHIAMKKSASTIYRIYKTMMFSKKKLEKINYSTW